MGLFGLGKKKEKNSSPAQKNPAGSSVKAPKDLRSLEDHVQGAYAAMGKQNLEDFAVPKADDEMGYSTPEQKEEFGEIYGSVTYNEFGYIMQKLFKDNADDPEYAPSIPYLKRQTIDDSTYFWFQQPVKDAVSVTANPKTGEIVFQDKFERSEQIIVAQYDERKQGFSSVTLYDSKNRYLNKNGIDISYAIDWASLTKQLLEKAEYDKKTYGSLFGFDVLGIMEYYDMQYEDVTGNGYVDIKGNFPSPEEFLKGTLKAIPKKERGLAYGEDVGEWKSSILKNKGNLFILDTVEMTWIAVKYILPQYELDSRDNRAYQEYIDTVHSLRAQCIEDMKKRHPGYVPNGSNADIQHIEDVKYVNRIEQALAEQRDKASMEANPAGYIHEKAAENAELMRQIQELAKQEVENEMGRYRQDGIFK